MRLNNDDTSIDILASSCSTEDLSRTLATLETIKVRKLSDWTKIDENIAVLREAIKRQTESKIYMFHSVDVLWEMMWELSRSPEWFAVFKRIWDRLIDFCWWDGTNIGYDGIWGFVKKNKITEVFTWTISWEFLWVHEVYDVEHCGEWDRHETKQLSDDEIKLLESLWVRVRILNILV